MKTCIKSPLKKKMKCEIEGTPSSHHLFVYNRIYLNTMHQWQCCCCLNWEKISEKTNFNVKFNLKLTDELFWQNHDLHFTK